MQKLRPLCPGMIESLATAESISLTRRRDVWRRERHPRRTRSISVLSRRLGITPVIFKIRRDMPWWKLLENFARRTETWNLVVLIPSGFRAPSGPKARRVRFAISAYTHRCRCDKYCSRVYIYAVGPSQRSHRFTRVWVNTALCESISRACSVSSVVSLQAARHPTPDGREVERKTAECSDSYSELLKRPARD